MMFKLVTVLAVCSVDAQFNPLRQRTMLRYVNPNVVVVEKAEDDELYANPNIIQKAEEDNKLYVNPNTIETAEDDKATNPNHETSTHDVVEKATDDKHRNPNLKADDIEYWNSVVSQSNMSYPIQAAAIHDEDTPCPTDDSSDAPSVSPSTAPSASPDEVVMHLEVIMSMSIPIQEEEDETYANPN